MKWYIARPFNMMFPNVLLNLLDHKHWKSQKNPAGIPSGLADWGFLAPVNKGNYHETDLGLAVKSAKWQWPEVVLHALVKRGSYEATVPVRPMVMMARALLKMAQGGLQKAYLTDRSFTRLANLSSYAQLTDEFCEHLNDPAKSREPGILVYQDIWLNALEAAGILEKIDGKFFLLNNKWVFEFLSLLDAYGEAISNCPLKDVDAQAYYQYMGDVSKGLPEILGKASPGLLAAMFPSYKVGAIAWTTLAPQESINTLEDFATAFEKEMDVSKCGLKYDKSLLSRFISALAAKPFVVLSGLAGSGKTKIAQVFTKWLSLDIQSRDNCFYVGQVFCRSRTDFTIVAMDAVGMVVAQGTGTKTSLSFELIDHWVDTIVKRGLTPKMKPLDMRNAVQNDHPEYSPNIQSFDSILKPLAFYKIDHSTVAVSMQTSLLVPVGADWTNSEKLLGYPNALDKTSYVMPDTGVLKLLMDAEKNPKLPFFLILDEMNLSHVERYFADFLSAMESGDEIKLYDGDQRYADKAKTIAVPRRIRVPKNLFVIGTMNVDETTYMFSPKVLDRAQVIEFRVKPDEMAKFAGHWEDGDGKIVGPETPGATWKTGTATKIDLDKLADPNGIGKGAKYAESFLELALKRGEKKPSGTAVPAAPAGKPANPDKGKVPLQEVAKAVNAFFTPLAELGAEFGYRSAAEIMSFCGFYIDAGAKIDAAIDAAIVQKLLPKVHGSRRKLERVLTELWKLCRLDGVTDDLDAVAKAGGEYDFSAKTKYPLSAEKVLRMFRAAMANGFASFAEA